MPTILVVDDNAPALKAAVRLLRQAGYEVAEACDGTEALRQVRALRPALVLLDVVMPDLSGLEVIQEIRADPALVGVSVVLLSSMQTTSEEQAAGLDAGADGYIARPIANTELLARVRSQLRQHDLTERLRASEQQLQAVAEEYLRTNPASRKPQAEVDARQLLHKLQVHQIELEMQNEEIRTARAELEIGLERYTDLFEFAPVGYFNLDVEGNIQLVNLTGAKLVDLERARLVGRRFGLFVSAPDRHVFTDCFARVFATQTRQTCEVALVSKERPPVFVRLDLMLSPDGKDCRVVMMDITERKQAEAELRESKGKLRKVIDGTGPYMFIGLMTPDGVLIEANRPALEAAGLKQDDVLGKPLPETYWWAWSETLQAQLSAAIAGAAGGVPSRYEVQIRVAEGALLWVDFSLFPVHDADGKVIFLVPSANVIDERKKAETALHEYSRRLLHVADEERRRIAKELHDSTAQDLVAVLLNLGNLQDALPGLAAEPQQILEDSVALLENCANDIRTLSYALHPPRLDEIGLAGGLAEYAAGLGRRADLLIHVEASPDFGRLPEDMEIALFRVAQECLGNVVRHSESKTATIRLVKNEVGVVLEVQDYGRGLPPGLDTQLGARGVGIAGMRERLQHLGGRLEIESEKAGTTVRAVLPWNKETK